MDHVFNYALSVFNWTLSTMKAMWIGTCLNILEKRCQERMLFFYQEKKTKTYFDEKLVQESNSKNKLEENVLQLIHPHLWFKYVIFWKLNWQMFNNILLCKLWFTINKSHAKSSVHYCSNLRSMRCSWIFFVHITDRDIIYTDVVTVGTSLESLSTYITIYMHIKHKNILTSQQRMCTTR